MEFALVLRWVTTFGILTLVGLPIAAWCFPRLPDRGAAFALPLSLLVLTMPVFWLGHVTFSTPTLAFGLVVLAGTSLLSLHRGATIRPLAAVESFLVFTFAFGLLLALRAVDPTIHPAGGEKFLHFGLVNAVLRADNLPPIDMWYAGETVRYYYGGHVMTALLTTLTGTEPRYAYNLAIAGFFGILVSVAYGLSGAISRDLGRSPRAGGLCGAFFVGLAGSPVTAVRFLYGQLPRDVALAHGEPVFGAVRHMPYEEAVDRLGDPFEWSWFYARYVVPDTLLEFPFYSFVKADLHGHTITTGFVLLVAALCFAYYRTPSTHRLRRRSLAFGAIPLAGGLLGVMNAWSLPTAAGLAWLALALAPAHPASLLPRAITGRIESGSHGVVVDGPVRFTTDCLVSEGIRLAMATTFALIVGLLSVLWAAPFLLFHTPVNDGIGFFPPRSPLLSSVLVFGTFFVLFGLYALTRGFPAYRSAWPLVLVGAPIFPILVVLAGPLDAPVVAIAGGLLLLGWLLVRTRDNVGFELVLAIAGLGLVLSMEVVHANVWPPAQDRWNTTLKVGIQAWVLCAIAAGPIATRMLGEVFDAIRKSTDRTVQSADRTIQSTDGRLRRTRRSSSTGTRCLLARSPRILGSLVVVTAVLVLLFGAGTFATVTIGQQAEVYVDSTQEANPTLDGLAAHDRWRAEEMAAIHWLAERDGTPHLVSAPGDASYTWQNPASTFTGIPTVVGWDHQQGYRGVEAFESRAADVDAIFVASARESDALLLEYEVSYVYVGPAERERYGDERRDFDGHDAFEVVFENEAVTIYAVDRSRLDGAA